MSLYEKYDEMECNPIQCKEATNKTMCKDKNQEVYTTTNNNK